MQRYRQRRRKDEFITATEIAAWAYCPEQWRLEHGLELLPANKAVRDTGTRHHASNTFAEVVAGWCIAIGQAIVVAALLLLLLWLVRR